MYSAIVVISRLHTHGDYYCTTLKTDIRRGRQKAKGLFGKAHLFKYTETKLILLYYVLPPPWDFIARGPAGLKFF
jgi:hypothetical protein